MLTAISDYRLEAAREAVTAFLEANGVETPRMEFVTALSKLDRARYGYYSRARGLVVVHWDQCAYGRLRGRFGPRLSVEGFWDDVTVLGVTAHEAGHHVEACRGWRNVVNRMYNAYMQEGPLCLNSKLNRHEDFADGMQLMITNPDLLRAVCPLRYEFMRSELGLEPTETRTWREILSSEPEATREVERRLLPA